MPVVCINWETIHLHGERWIAHLRLRHQLFVERQGWDVPTFRGMEHDQFDTPAAQYLLWLDDAGDTRGAARLIPTTRPYMVQQLWPDLVPGDLPRSDTVWEATRFCCDPLLELRTRRRAVTEILSAVYEYGITNGIQQYLVVMPVRLLRTVLMKAGCHVQVLGPKRILGSLPAAAALAVTPEVLAEIRRRGQLHSPALRTDMALAA